MILPGCFKQTYPQLHRGNPSGASFWTAGASGARPRFGKQHRWVRAWKFSGEKRRRRSALPAQSMTLLNLPDRF